MVNFASLSTWARAGSGNVVIVVVNVVVAVVVVNVIVVVAVVNVVVVIVVVASAATPWRPLAPSFFRSLIPPPHASIFPILFN